MEHHCKNKPLSEPCTYTAIHICCHTLEADKRQLLEAYKYVKRQAGVMLQDLIRSRLHSFMYYDTCDEQACLYCKIAESILKGCKLPIVLSEICQKRKKMFSCWSEKELRF